MKSMLASIRPDISTVARIAVLATPSALIGGIVIWSLNPKATADEVAAAVAVPMLVCYVLVRLVDAAVSNIKTSAETETAKKPSSATFLLVTLFGIGLWITATAALSSAFYWAVGMNWAMDGAFQVIKTISLLVAFVAVLICIRALCRVLLIRIADLVNTLTSFPLHRWLIALTAFLRRTPDLPTQI